MIELFFLVLVLMAIIVHSAIYINKNARDIVNFSLEKHELDAGYRKGINYLNEGNFKLAEVCFSNSIKHKFEIENSFLKRGEANWGLENFDKAFADWEEAKKRGSLEANRLITFYSIEKRNNEILDSHDIRYLYHITHIQNLKSILAIGLKSHNLAYSLGLTSKDISDNQVNERREKIHNYVPLYFTPKNPMLFRRKNIQSDLVILCINRGLLMQNMLFTDGNAASKSTKIYSNIQDLNKINWDILKSKYWTDHVDGKRIKCSEVLIPNEIGVNSIQKIICYDQKSIDYVNSISTICKISMELNRNYYF